MTKAFMATLNSLQTNHPLSTKIRIMTASLELLQCGITL